MDHAPWQDTQRRVIFHIAHRDDWEAARAQGVYTVSTKGRTLEEEGFIHASFNHDQIQRVGNFLYASESDPLIILVIETALLDSAVVAENLEGGDELYAHVYGPVSTNAVVATVRARARGTFAVEWDDETPAPG